MPVAPDTPSYDFNAAMQRRLGIIQDNSTAYNNDFLTKLRAQQQNLVQPQVQSQWNSANADATSLGNRLVTEASKLKGTPYVWGGESFKEGGFDCSGLVQYVYGKMGIKTPRTAAQQASTMGKVTAIQNLRPGDLVAWGSSPATAHHIAIYAGNGMVWQAPHTGDVVKYSKITGNDVFGISVRYQ